MAEQPVSLRQMAQQMNVAVSTVSRALAGDRGVGAKRAGEIRRLARSLGYRPRPLRRKRADAIALLIATPKPGVADDIFQQMVISQVERCASAQGRHVHVEFTSREESAAAPAVLAENRVDGVVLTGHPSADLCWRLRDSETPVVVIEDHVERTGCSSVMTDFGPGVAEAIGRLGDLGHERIGLVISRREYPSIARRYHAYVETLRAIGIAADPEWVIENVEPTVAGGRTAVQLYLERRDPPTAILFGNDWMALGGLNELLRRGYHVPRDISLVGHDNISICEELSPALTSVDGRVAELVGEAMELLEQQIAGESGEPVQRNVEGYLVWRESCGENRKVLNGSA